MNTKVRQDAAREKALARFLVWLEMNSAKATRIVRDRSEDLEGDPWIDNCGWADPKTIVVVADEYPKKSCGLNSYMNEIDCGVGLEWGEGDGELIPLYYTVFTRLAW